MRTGMAAALVSQFARMPERIFVNHGDDGAATALRPHCGSRFGVAADAPFSGSVFDLVSGAWENTAEPVRIDGREEKAQAAKSNKDRAYDALLDAARRPDGRGFRMPGTGEQGAVPVGGSGQSDYS